MKTLTIILLLLLTLMGCSKVIYPGHDYYDRLVVGTTKNAYITKDIYGRNTGKIYTENPDSIRIGQWLTLKDEFKR